MSSRRSSRFYVLLAAASLAILAFLVGVDYLSYDRTHFAQQVENLLQAQESKADLVLRQGNWIDKLRGVRSGNRMLSNDLVRQLEDLTALPFSIYVYDQDTLLFWSKPGLIIDPRHREFRQIPCIIRDHRQDYFVKKALVEEGGKSLAAYFKIPILPEDEQVFSVAVLPFKFGAPSPAGATLIRSNDGSPIAHIDLLTKEHPFWMQASFLVLALVAFWAFGLAWIFWVNERPVGRLSPINQTLLQILGLFTLRLATLYLPYQDFLDQLTLLSPIIRDIPFPYSTLDLLLDAALFLAVCVLSSKLYGRSDAAVTATSSNSVSWSNRLMTVGHYLMVILMSGLTAWILRQVVGQSYFGADLAEVSFLDVRHFLSILACGIIIMGVFTFSFQIVTRAIQYTRTFYERMITLLVAGVVSLPLIFLFRFDLPFAGFYLGVFILMTLLDLYIEQGHKSVIWVMGWLVAIASLSALILYKYQRDFERIARTEWIENAPIRQIPREQVEEKLLDWLPALPRKYSLAVYDRGQLVFAHQYDYPVALGDPDQYTPGVFYAVPTAPDRMDITMRDAGGRVFLIGKKEEGIGQVLSLFSLVFTIFSLLLFLLAGLNAIFQFLPGNMELTISPRPSFRNKIQIAVVMIILLTFGLVGLLTVYYLRTSSRADELRRYDERLRTLANSVRQSISPENETWRIDMRQASRIALAQNVNSQVYDPEGNLIRPPEESERSVRSIPVKMAFLPKIILDAGSRDYFLNVSGADGRRLEGGEAGYVAIHHGGSASGYLELNEILPGTGESDDPGSTFIMTLLNAYVFIFLLAITMAVFMSRSITRPVEKLSEKLKKIRLGKKNETISWSIDDEIGELIRDYNAMVTKLDESALLLAQSERDLAWREMAKQVAHEIKNPLTPMKLSIQYLQNASARGDQAGLPEMIHRVARTLIEQIENLTHIASEFSSYAKMPQAQNEVFVLNDVVASVHDLFRKREDMDIQLQVPINDLYVFADKSQMIRVLNNVVKNAMQSIPATRRGLIVIKLTFSDDFVILSVSDNGTGIDEHMRDKVFYPNFTTKSSGMGLGLAICSDIIQSFDGRIYFETEKGVGTTFFITLPRHQVVESSGSGISAVRAELSRD